MVTIKSFLLSGLNVPLPTTAGAKKKYIHIPAREKDGSPGVLELEDGLDAVTLQRLRHHYDWRPTDAKNLGKERSDLQDDEISDIGLLRIEVDGEPLRVSGDDAEEDEDEGTTASGPVRGPKKKKKGTAKRKPGEAPANEGAS